MTTWSQPLVHRNDWSSLVVPAVGSWTPTMSVSMVLPAWNAGRSLPYVLAGLAAQTYPAHLLEVVVVDDGSQPPLELSTPAPENTRLVRVQQGWGRGNARNLGVEATDGDVVHWLDADMVLRRDAVEAQLRWHHVIDYAVVLGAKLFVDPEPLYATHTPEEVAAAVAAGRDDEFFAEQHPVGHKWVEGMWRRTDQLRRAGTRGFRSHVTPTGSLRRTLFAEVGGMSDRLNMGEDVELGYRLSEAGAVLIPEHESRSWHLGTSQVMREKDRVNRYNDAHLSNLVPGMRPKRIRSGRAYDTPYLEVVIEMDDLSERVIDCVDSFLDSEVFDLRVVLVGNWDTLDWSGRRAELLDPRLEERIVARTYANEPRVELRTSRPEGRSPATYRLELEDTAWAPLRPSLLAMLEDVERTHQGGREILADGRRVAALRATSATSRAVRVGADTGERVDEAIAEAYGTVSLSTAEAGWVPTAERLLLRHEGKAERDWEPARSRALFDEAIVRARESHARAVAEVEEATEAEAREKAERRAARLAQRSGNHAAQEPAAQEPAAQGPAAGETTDEHDGDGPRGGLFSGLFGRR